MDIYWGIPLTLFYLFLFLYLIKKWSFFTDNSISKKLFYTLFLYKFFLGLCLTFVYTYYYTDRQLADIYKYYDDSYYMTQALWQKPIDFFKMLFGIDNDSSYFTKNYYAKMNHWFRMYETNVYNDNHTIIRFNAVVRLFSFGFFHIHTAFVSFLSFQGIVAFYKGFCKFVQPNNHKTLGILILLFPSLNFWSAGVLKEGLLIFTLGNIFYLTIVLFENKNIARNTLLISIFIFITMHIKSYSLAIMCCGLLFLIAGKKFSKFSLWLIYPTIFILLFIAYLVLSKIYPDYHIPSIIAQKQNDFIRLSEYMNAGSAYTLNKISPEWNDIILNIPMAWVTGIFRPFIFESNSVLCLLSSFESIFILLLLVYTAFYFNKPNREQWNLFFSSLIIVSGLAILIGISTPNFGSLVRYKVPFLPFLITMPFLLIDISKINFYFVNHDKRKKL